MQQNEPADLFGNLLVTPADGPRAVGFIQFADWDQAILEVGFVENYHLFGVDNASDDWLIRGTRWVRAADQSDRHRRVLKDVFTLVEPGYDNEENSHADAA